MAPWSVQGDEPASDPAQARTLTTVLAWLLVAGIGLLAIAAIAGIPRVCRLVPRRVALAAAALGSLASMAALVVAWSALPSTLAGYGVTGPFSAALVGDTYVRSTLEYGWVAAALGVLAGIVAFALQFQAGSSDPALVESIAHAQGAR